jgi:hypothetical protein
VGKALETEGASQVSTEEIIPLTPSIAKRAITIGEQIKREVSSKTDSFQSSSLVSLYVQRRPDISLASDKKGVSLKKLMGPRWNKWDKTWEDCW